MTSQHLTREELSALTALHTRCIQAARDHERAARRLPEDESGLVELAFDQATEARAEAAALAKLLSQHGVNAPPPGQLSLWADGSEL